MNPPIEIEAEDRDFTGDAIAVVVERGMLDQIDLTSFNTDSLPRFTRDEAEAVAKDFARKIFNQYAHRRLARALAFYVATETEIPVDIDGDGVPDVPTSPARFEWLKRVFTRDDFQD